MLCDLHELFANSSWLIAIAVSIASVVRFSRGFVFEVRSIESRGESVGCLEVAHEMTFVIQPNLERNLFHAQKTRLEQVLRALHAQQSQITNRRHADVGLEDMTEPPNRQVYRLRELRERQFPTNVVSHHLDDFFDSFIHQTPGEMLSDINQRLLTSKLHDSRLLRDQPVRELSGSWAELPCGKTESDKK